MSQKPRKRDTRFDYYPVDEDDPHPEDFQTPEEHFEWHSKPVARSLAILDKLGLLIEERGRTDKIPGFLPFGVEIKVSGLTPLPEEDLEFRKKEGLSLEPERLYVSARRELHAIAHEALRRAEGQGLIPPPDT